MAKVEIDDPELYSTKRTDKQGRLYIGRKYADQDVEFVIVNSGDDLDPSGSDSSTEEIDEASPTN